jgi:hypothetical protein
MRKPSAAEMANAFLWLAVLAATLILFWGSERVWVLVVGILGCGWASVGIVARGCRGSGG